MANQQQNDDAHPEERGCCYVVNHVCSNRPLFGENTRKHQLVHLISLYGKHLGDEEMRSLIRLCCIL